MNIIEFGSGKVSVSTAKQDSEVDNLLIIEPGKGTGKIHEEVPDRKKGTEVILEDLEGVCFRFANLESAKVVKRKMDRIVRELSK